MNIRSKLEENRDYIIKSYRSGKSTTQLGDEFNCNHGNIYLFLIDNGVTPRTVKKGFVGQLKDYKDQILSKFDSGMNCTQIAKEIGSSVCSMVKFVSKYRDTSINRVVKDTGFYLKHEQVVELYQQGKNASEIARILGHAESTVSVFLNTQGFELSNTVYSVDETFFEKIDTPEKAYCLGMIYSDGNIMQNEKGWRIELSDVDEDILIKIKNVIKYTGPILHSSRADGYDSRASLCVTRKKMAHDLVKLGCPPAKSLILKFPTEDIVPRYLHNHYLRGVSDGDGSVRKRYFNITGSYYFIHELPKYLPCEITGIYKRYKDRPDHETAWSLFVCRHEEKMKVLDWLYKDSTIHMDRKYNTYLKLKETS